MPGPSTGQVGLLLASKPMRTPNRGYLCGKPPSGLETMVGDCMEGPPIEPSKSG